MINTRRTGSSPEELDPSRTVEAILLRMNRNEPESVKKRCARTAVAATKVTRWVSQSVSSSPSRHMIHEKQALTVS